MAARDVVISEPLCFLRNRFGKIPESMLKEALVDFFDAGVLALAKSRLIDDIDKLGLSDRPHAARHHAGANQARLEIDDLVKLFLSTKKCS